MGQVYVITLNLELRYPRQMSNELEPYH